MRWYQLACCACACVHSAAQSVILVRWSYSSYWSYWSYSLPARCLLVLAAGCFEMAPVASVKANRGKKIRKHVSMKNKFAWRKYCNTKEVDKYLEEQRHEERVGVKFNVAADDKLFFVDKKLTKTKPNRKNRARKILPVKKKPPVVPKCFENLYSYTSVPDPVKKRNKVRSIEERKHPIQKRKETLHAAQGIMTAKEKMAARNRELDQKKKEKESKGKKVLTDLWDESPTKEFDIDNASDVDQQWLNPTTSRHIVQHTRKYLKKAPETVQRKPSILPAIEEPHPGMSYNPSYVDHKALLVEKAEKEKVLIKQEEHLIRVTTNMFHRVTADEREKSWIKEMSEGHPISLTYIVKDEEEEKSENVTSNPPTINKKKTLKQRRKLRLAKEEELKRQLEAAEKKKMADIYKVKKIMETLDEEESLSLKKQAKRAGRKEMKKGETLRLARAKFEEPEQGFALPHELSGNLRGVINQGNLLRDRWKRLEQRNILRPSVLQQKKRGAKRKVFARNSHK